jgi:hypothetical protein
LLATQVRFAEKWESSNLDFALNRLTQEIIW